MRRIDCHDALKQVLISHGTATRTARVLIGLALQQPEYLTANELSLPELRSLEQGLHDLYFTRLFASFESSLRHYWRTSVKNTKPATNQLINAVATRRGVPQDKLDTVHEIREFRNVLIHEEHEAGRRFTLDEASRHLNTYLARLPLEW